jgi:hypothetical protein
MDEGSSFNPLALINILDNHTSILTFIQKSTHTQGIESVA